MNLLISYFLSDFKWKGRHNYHDYNSCIRRYTAAIIEISPESRSGGGGIQSFSFESMFLVFFFITLI